MSKPSKVSVDVRMAVDEKARLQAEADALGLNVSELVRQIVLTERDAAAPVDLDLDSEPLSNLRRWLNLADSDGNLPDDLLTEWKEAAEAHGLSFPALLRLAVIEANKEYLS